MEHKLLLLSLLSDYLHKWGLAFTTCYVTALTLPGNSQSAICYELVSGRNQIHEIYQYIKPTAVYLSLPLKRHSSQNNQSLRCYKWNIGSCYTSIKNMYGTFLLFPLTQNHDQTKLIFCKTISCEKLNTYVTLISFNNCRKF